MVWSGTAAAVLLYYVSGARNHGFFPFLNGNMSSQLRKNTAKHLLTETPNYHTYYIKPPLWPFRYNNDFSTNLVLTSLTLLNSFIKQSLIIQRFKKYILLGV